MHFIHSNRLLIMIDELRYIAALKISTILGLSKSKLDCTFLKNKVEIERYYS